MMYLHIVPGANDVANGMARVARLLAKEQGDAEVVDLNHEIHEKGESGESLRFSGERLEEVWVHGMWLPREWAVCWRVIKSGKRLVRMTHGSLSPVYLKQQGRWKKWLVGPIERWLLRRCAKIVATCDAEKEWIEAYLGKRCPAVEVTDVKRFFDLGDRSQELGVSESSASGRALHLLYLGRRHPLKGLEYLEQAVKGIEGIELRIVSNAFGEEKEKVWDWCDVLVLPTLSENFGLVVAEALERGKRVITTDGAPVWDPMGSVGVRECGIGGVRMGEREDSSTLNFDSNILIGYGGRLLYLRGYRDGAAEDRILLLNEAIKRISK